MDTGEVLTFLDLETAGLDPNRHPIIQVAGIAVDERLVEIESIEIKVRFGGKDANPESLKKNSYDPARWAREAVKPRVAAERFAAFLRRHATVDTFSKLGKRYELAQLVAHNAAFDGPFLHTWYKKLGLFCPARYQVFCTLQRALWYFDEHKEETPPGDFRLGTLCQYFGLSHPESAAHDALADIRATVGLYRAIVDASRRPRSPLLPSSRPADFFA